MPYLSKSNPTAAEIKHELESTFADVFTAAGGPARLADCVKVGAFLADTAQVHQGLIGLEKELRVGAGADFERAIKHYKAKAGDASMQEKLDANLRHLLARELTQLEIRCGFNTFNCLGQERAQTYVAFISPEVFRKQLTLGRHWKDPAVPGEHGEYTHRIQWYLCARAGAVAAPVDLFMWIGSVIDGNPENKPNGLWDALFDRIDRTQGSFFKVDKAVTDSRCPESLTRYITDDQNEQAWPLLHWYIKARLRKRSSYPLNNYFSARSYVDKKLKAFGIEMKAEDIVGPPNRKTMVQGPGIVEPGALVKRTQ